ncbi:MAG: family 78 glycoside hydrolase catalytic domain [Lachnospiraceae bacterium]|nr:family 78 glycoside hydrolase catalytic domain [Lachnospiraceae bacterium]
MSREWTAKWIGRQDGDTFNPVFFKDFTVDFPISRAMFNITALGVFEAYINGQRVGDAYLTPYQTGDKDGVPYYAYDITDLLYAGQESPSNSIDVFLGQGWNDDDKRIALRAEVVLERSGEPAEEALAMEFDELEAEPGDYADEDDYELFDEHEIESFIKEDDPFEASDDLLNELIGDDAPVFDDAPALYDAPAFDDALSFDDAPELPGLPETMDMPDTLAGREYRSRTRRMRRWNLELVQDPEQEAAKELLADIEPDFEIISEPEDVPVVPKETKPDEVISEDDLFSEDDLQGLMDDSVFMDEIPEDLDEMPLDVLEELEGMSQEAPSAFVPKEDLLEFVPQEEAQVEKEERGFSDSMPEMDMTEDEIQSILAEQEKELSAAIPTYSESIPEKIVVPDLFAEDDLEEALGDAGDLMFDEAAPEEVDSLVDELAAEFGEEPAVTVQEPVEAIEELSETAEASSELTPEEASWNDDVEGQVSFDFIGKIQAIMDEEKAAKAAAEAMQESEAEEAVEEAIPAEAVQEEAVPEAVVQEEAAPVEAPPAEAAPVEAMPVEAAPVEDVPVETVPVTVEAVKAAEETVGVEDSDFTEELFDESILEEFPEEELTEDIFDEISDEIFEEASDEIPVEAAVDAAEEVIEDAEDEIPFEIEEIVVETEEPVNKAVEEVPEAAEEVIEEVFEEPAEEIVLEEAVEEAVEAPVEEAVEEPVKKQGFFKKHFKAFDLAKKIGLTLDDEEEPEPEEPDAVDLPEEVDEYDEYDDMDLSKLDELGELFTDTSQLADMEAVLAGLDSVPGASKASAASGPMGDVELPAFEDLFAEADSLAVDKAMSLEETFFADDAVGTNDAVDADEVLDADLDAALEEALSDELPEELLSEEALPEEASLEETIEAESEAEAPEEAIAEEELEAEPQEDVPEEETAEIEPEAEIEAEVAEGVIPVPVILPGAEEEAGAEEETAEETVTEEAVEEAQEQEEEAVEEAQKQEEAAEEPIVVIGTDETWGYYGSDIEENRIHGREVFNRLLWEGKDNPDKDAVVLECDIPLTEAEEEQLRVLEELKVQTVIPAEKGGSEWTLDFGKLFKGLVSFQSDFAAGTKITLTFMDALTDDAQDQQFIYVSDGIQETVCPHFTFFHGRYVKVTGWGEMDAASFTGYRLFEEEEEPEAEVIGVIAEEPEAAEESPTEEADAVEEPVEESGEEPVEESGEEPVDEAVEESIEEPIEESIEKSIEEKIEEPIDAAEEAALDEALADVLDEEFGDELTEDLAEEAAEEVCFVSTSEAQLNQAVQDELDKQKAMFAALAASETGTDVEKIATGDFCGSLAAAALNGNIKEAAMQYFGRLRKAQLANGKAIPASLAVNAEEAPEDGTITDGAEAVKAVWSLYETYGDKAILEENYDLIRDALDAAAEQDPDKAFILQAPKMDDDDTDPSFVATVSYYEMAQAAEKAAKVLGKEEDEKQFADLAGNIKEAFLDEFFTRSGRLAEDTQTAYILALKSGLYDQKDKLKEDFLKQLKKDRYQMKCGKAGRTQLPFALAECGQSDLAYRYLMNDWMSDNADDLSASDNEKTAEFLTRYVNGITALEPGFTKVKIAPMPNFRLIDAAGTCATPNGNIVSNWDVNEEGQIHFHFEIPEGCEALVVLPDCEDEALKEQTLTAGTYDFDYMPQKDYLHLFNENSVIGDILKYDESVAVLEEADASLAEQIQSAGADLLTRPLDELPVDAQTISAIKEKLFELK